MDSTPTPPSPLDFEVFAYLVELLVHLLRPSVFVEHVEVVRQVPQTTNGAVAISVHQIHRQVRFLSFEVLEYEGTHDGVGDDEGADADLREGELERDSAAVLEFPHPLPFPATGAAANRA